MSKFDTSDKKNIESIFSNATSHSDADSYGYCKARRKLVGRELHCSKTCIFNIKWGWQENRLERPMRIGVGKVSLLKFTFTLIMY
jgi:hypothetical protein